MNVYINTKLIKDKDYASKINSETICIVEQSCERCTKAIFEKYFYDLYRPIVVLANSKTVVNMKYAKKEVKNQVIKADQIIEYIKKINDEPSVESSSDKQMLELAEYFLNLHTENKVDYLEKYRSLVLEEKEEVIGQMPKEITQVETLAHLFRWIRMSAKN
jgi:hypothetical protein